MRARSTIAAALLLPAALLSVAAHVPDGCYVAIAGDEGPEDDIIACELQTWFHGAETLASNLGNVEGSPHGSATFDINPPTKSVTEGGGAGYLTNSGVTQTAGGDVASATFDGTFTGIIDVIDVDLHVLAELPITADAFNIVLSIDGFDITTLDEVDIPRTADPDTNAASRMDFAFTGLAQFIVDYLGGDTEHTVQLRIEPTYIINDTTVFAFDTTEADGGITFNPLTIPAGTTRF